MIIHWSLAAGLIYNFKFILIFYRVFIIVSSVLAICNYGLTQSIEGECALHLNGPGRTSFFDFNTNTLRGGPQ